MPTIPVFGEKHFKKGLKKLGFQIFDDRGKGGHKLAKHPIRSPSPERSIRNITIPHTRNGKYDDPNLRSELVKQVCCFDFTQEDVIKAIKK